MRGQQRTTFSLIVQKAQEASINNSGAWTIIDSKKLVYHWLSIDLVYICIRQSKVKTKSVIMPVFTPTVTTDTTYIVP